MSELQKAAGQSVARTQSQQEQASHLIESMKPALAKAMPRGLDPERMARIVLTEVRKNPKLAEASQQSFAGAMLTAATLGLEPGVNGECYLVPYKGEVQLLVGYQGMVKLFLQHPQAKSIDAQVVYPDDFFEWELGTDAKITHRPGPKRNGEPTHYYAVAELLSGAKQFVVLTADEVKKLRGGKTGTSGPIADPMHWMEKKTAVRQLFKMIPKTTQMLTATTVDERLGSDLHRDLPLIGAPTQKQQENAEQVEVQEAQQ